MRTAGMKELAFDIVFVAVGLAYLVGLMAIGVRFW